VRRVEGSECIDALWSPSGVALQLVVTNSRLEPAEAPKLATWRCDLRIALARLDKRITITPPLFGHGGGYFPNAHAVGPPDPVRNLTHRSDMNSFVGARRAATLSSGSGKALISASSSRWPPAANRAGRADGAGPLSQITEVLGAHLVEVAVGRVVRSAGRGQPSDRRRRQDPARYVACPAQRRSPANGQNHGRRNG
jgi:hypothetical protein